MIISNGPSNHKTIDGKVFSTFKEAKNHNAQRRSAIEKKIGRQLTSNEWLSQQLKAATDTRTPEEKQSFTVKMNGQKSAIERERDRVALDIEIERINKLSSNERRLHDIDSKILEDKATLDAEAAYEARLKKYSRIIKRLEELKEESAWDLEADERDRVLIDQQLELIRTPNSDLRQLRVDEVDSRQRDKRAGKLAKIEEQRHTLKKMLNDLPPERPLSTGGLPTIQIDQTKPLVEQAEHIVSGMFQLGYDYGEQIKPVQDAIETGEGLQELVDTYAKPAESQGSE